MSWELVKRWIVPTPAFAAASATVAPGLYHFQRETEDGYLRYHLRVDPGGHGLLIASASEAIHLSPHGAALAKGLLEGRSPADLARQSGAAQKESEVLELKQTIDQLGQPSGRYPIFNLADPMAGGRNVQLPAPFQADVVPGDRDTLLEILPRLWDAGLPHVRFVVGDVMNLAVVADAIRHAGDLGMIVGVRAPIAHLGEGQALIRFWEMGLDYLVVPWSVTPQLHATIYGSGDYEQLGDNLREARRLELCPVVEIPLYVQSEEALQEGIDRLVAWDVENIEVFAIAVDEGQGPGTPASGPLTPFAARQLRQVAAWIEDLAAERPMQIVWLPPVAMPPGKTVAQMARAGPRAGSDISIRVEADGSVIPPRGPYQVAGNLLQNPWPDIWRHAAFRRYREKVEQVTRCDACPGLAICAADCPADPVGWATAGEGR